MDAIRYITFYFQTERVQRRSESCTTNCGPSCGPGPRGSSFCCPSCWFTEVKATPGVLRTWPVSPCCPLVTAPAHRHPTLPTTSTCPRKATNLGRRFRVSALWNRAQLLNGFVGRQGDSWWKTDLCVLGYERWISVSRCSYAACFRSWSCPCSNYAWMVDIKISSSYVKSDKLCVCR